MPNNAKTKASKARVVKKRPVPLDGQQDMLNPQSFLDSVSQKLEPQPEKAPDIVETTVKKPVPTSEEGVFVPSSVKRGFSTTNAVTKIFEDLETPPVGEGMVSQARPAKSKVIVDTGQVLLTDGFNEFDRAVLEAVIGQLASGNKTMTPGMIFRTMAGKKTYCTVSEDMIRAVDESITKCMYTPAVLPLFDKETGNLIQYLDGPVLNLVRGTKNVVGNRVQTYEIQSVPIIYRYCTAMNAITYSPIEMLCAPVNMTKRSLSILNALQRTISPFVWSIDGVSMRAEKGEKDIYKPDDITIRYDDIYEIAASQSGPTEREEDPDEDGSTSGKYSWFLTSKARETCQKVLTYWVEQGYIKAFANNKYRRKMVSITIRFYPISAKYLPLPEITPIKLEKRKLIGPLMNEKKNTKNTAPSEK